MVAGSTEIEREYKPETNLSTQPDIFADTLLRHVTDTRREDRGRQKGPPIPSKAQKFKKEVTEKKVGKTKMQEEGK